MRLTASFNSGAFRFALIIAALFAAGSIVLLVVVESSIRAYADEATTVSLNSETSILVRELSDGGIARLADTIRHRQSPGAEQQFRYLLIDAHRKPLAGDLPIDAARRGRGQVQFVDDRSDPAEDGDPEVLQSLGTLLSGGALLVVATDSFDIQMLREKIDGFTVVSGVVITMLALVGGYLTGAVLLMRLDRVNVAVARIMAGSLSERLPAIGMSAEFDRLSQNLNLMLDRIGELMDGLRQVSTDIAHDLRTPLTRLRQQLEEVRETGSLGAYEQGVEAALEQTDDILAIFRALLRIGVIEGGEGRQLLTTIDLSEIVERMTQIYRPVAEDDGKRLIAEIRPGVAITGDAELVAQMISNLLENALKYTSAGATITATVECSAGLSIATIADDGPGVPAGEHDKILRRFYRIDSSRGAPGAGLGLSLVAAIARMHGGDIVVDDNNPGLRVRLIFPEPML